ncbi:MAG TPA: hypothetical protein P5555_19330 [Candidatus Paceibacterota bacterium]|nr:hypothetical protein [Verrucomicrobiota bacterium]HRZ47338.1 hypothetical protein [Candidatus Paceibacterota bacterium]HRZ93374.1 hypothetical protein [Candidatus Paceibacterota bacterium]
MIPAHSTPAPTLDDLRQIQLSGIYMTMWELAQKECGGPAACRQRFAGELHDLLGLAQISGRMIVHWADLSAGLRAKVEIEMPVPCMPDPAGPLRVAPRALLGVIYPPEAIFMPQPGYAFIRILSPRPVWLSTVSVDPNQPLCLGAQLPAGIPLSEIVLMTYGALTLQTVQLDRLDPAGVLNAAAADWWQRNVHRIPLTREPFLRSEPNHAT